MTEELLTVRQVQRLLKVDRITVYRMLKDGRLHGIKIGHEWRFARSQVDGFVARAQSPAQAQPQAPALPARNPSPSAAGLPIHCIQLLQNVFSNMAEVGALTTTTDGIPLTEPSNRCHFSALVQSTPTGRAACLRSWREAAAQDGPGYATCHTGLQYAHAPVVTGDGTVAVLFAGPFYVEAADEQEQAERVERLAAEHGIDRVALAGAAAHVPVLTDRQREHMASWLESVANTMAEMGRERSALVGRLQNIAALTEL
jgi:excisionase family DNA binding protein